MAMRLNAAVSEFRKLIDGGARVGRSDAWLLERFVCDRDEAAFEVILRRHGPMVMGVCRNVLKDPNDAEDAFQAVFLVLIRKAGSIWVGDSLAGWLFRVSRRIAIEANRQCRRKDRRESAFLNPAAIAAPEGAGPWSDSVPILHQEIDRLPEKYRSAIVLCELEEKTHEQAAQELGLPAGTVSTRVSRGRSLLKGRLQRKGVMLGIPPLAGVASVRSANASVSPALAAATVRSAAGLALGNRLFHAGGKSVAGSQAVRLTSSLLRSMALARLKLAGAACFVLLLGGGIVISAAAQKPGEEPAKPAQKSMPKEMMKKADLVRKDAPKPKAPIVYRGRVLDPAGRPVAGATVKLAYAWMSPQNRPGPGESKTDPAGAFSMTLTPELIREIKTQRNDWFGMHIVAAAPGFALGWTAVADWDQPVDRDLTVRLSEDSVSVRGKVVNLENKPVAGATIEVLAIITPKPDFETWFAEVKTGKPTRPANQEFLRDRVDLRAETPAPRGVTDPSGKFTLEGLGKDRLALVMIRGDDITPEFVLIATRDDDSFKPVSYPIEPGFSTPVFASNVTITAGPGGVVAGVVTDALTKLAVPDATVMLSELGPFCSDKTDRNGKYILRGIPRTGQMANVLSIVVLPPAGSPYFSTQRVPHFEAGLTPAKLDFALGKGIRLEGKLTEKGTGAGVLASVEYFALKSNPNLGKQAPDLAKAFPSELGSMVNTDPAGGFRILVLPGEGLLAFKTAAGVYKETPRLSDPDAVEVAAPQNFAFFQSQYPALTRVNLVGDAISPIRVELERLAVQKGTIVGPDGKPETGAYAYGLQDSSWSKAPLQSAAFEFSHKDPGKPDTLLFLDPKQHLGGWIDVTGKETEPLVARLEKTAVFKGRFLDVDGNPKPGEEILVFFNRGSYNNITGAFHFDQRVKTDRAGRFEVANAIGGIKYQLLTVTKPGTFLNDGFLSKTKSAEHAAKAGETIDLGDLTEHKIGQ